MYSYVFNSSPKNANVDIETPPSSITLLIKLNNQIKNDKCLASQQAQNTCKTFVQRRPTASTLDQHCTNAIQMFCVYWVSALGLRSNSSKSLHDTLGSRDMACSEIGGSRLVLIVTNSCLIYLKTRATLEEWST